MRTMYPRRPALAARAFAARPLSILSSAVLGLALCVPAPTQQGCVDRIAMDLEVHGPGTPGSDLIFALSGARTDEWVFVFIGGIRADSSWSGVPLCIQSIGHLPLSPVGPFGSAQLTFPIPAGLPAALQLRLFAQAIAIPPSVDPQDVRTSSVAQFDLFGAAPFAVTATSPGAGAEGTTVQIDGQGFGSDASAVTVFFDHVPVPPTSVTDTQIQVVVPFLPNEEPVEVSVQVGIPRASAGTFQFGPSTATSAEIPGRVSLEFATRAATLSPLLEGVVRVLGGRVADVHWRNLSVDCVVPPGQEDAFRNAAQQPTGAVAAQREPFSGEENGMGDADYPNDPQRANQWGLDLVGGALPSGPAFWRLPSGGLYPPFVGVLDSGVDYSSVPNETLHQDLTGRIVLPEPIQGVTATDFDLVERPRFTGANRDRVPEDTNPSSHGTHVTGVIAALAHNGLDVTGMTSSTRVLPIRWRAGKTGQTATLAQGIGRASAFGARILNISASMADLRALRDALNAAHDAGVLIIKSAGNGGRATNGWNADVTYPGGADHPDIILVSGLDSTRDGGELVRWPVSSRTQPGEPQNRRVDLAAPGENIVSLIRGDSNSGAAGKHGTSYAAPQVAAAAAIVWSWSPRRPGETAAQWRDRVREMLLTGCVRDITRDGTGAQVAARVRDFGGGRLDMNGKVAFHSYGPQCYSQRVDFEPNEFRAGVAAPYERRSHFAGMNPRWSPERRAVVYDVFDPNTGSSSIRIQPIGADGANDGAVTTIAFSEPVAMGAFDPSFRGGEQANSDAIDLTRTWICFLRRKPGDPSKIEVWACRRDGTGEVALYTGGAFAETPCWSPDGSEIVVADAGNIVRVTLARDNVGTVTGSAGAATILQAGSTATTSFSYHTPAWSPDGNRIAVMKWELFTTTGGGQSTIFTVRPAGGGAVALITETFDVDMNGPLDFGPAWTPDGRRVVFHTQDRRAQEPRYRHRIRRILATGGTATDVYATTWQADAPRMGAPALSARFSAVDSSRF